MVKLCPLKMVTGSPCEGSFQCDEKACAWYDPSQEACAVRLIAYYLANLEAM